MNKPDDIAIATKVLIIGSLWVGVLLFAWFIAKTLWEMYK